MGLAFSYPEEDYDAFDQSLDALLKSLNLGNDYTKTTRKSMRSMSFNGRDSEPVLKAWGSGKWIIKRSLSFNKKDKDLFHVEPKHTTKSPKTRKAHFEKEKKPSIKNTRFGPLPEKVNDPKHEAAVKLQKVYKSFRTRRQLADCAVLVEQRWWKLLDFAMLKMNSVSFFDIKKTESALSKWTRAKSRAAKVGKGLSKDEKARKLALQHWLEAIDPRHRYGHNLHFYYDQWLICESKQPFFYWLDVGEGKEVSLDDKCPRHKLQSQCIKYLGPKEREGYEVIVEDGKLMYKNSGKLLDSTEGSGDSKWIFVLSTLKSLYVGQKKKGVFQHSSFLAGGATSAAGRLEVQNGILKAIWPHSGHYRPTEENFQEFILYLKSKNVDLDNVKTSPIEDEEEPGSKIETVFSSLASSINASVNYDNARNDLEGSTEEVKVVDVRPKQRAASELILRRSKFRKDTLSLQLVKQTSCKWSSGTGPRISCVRDFPSEIRFRALEEVSLSPRPNPFKVWNVSGNLPSPIPRAAKSSAGVAET